MNQEMRRNGDTKGGKKTHKHLANLNMGQDVQSQEEPAQGLAPFGEVREGLSQYFLRDKHITDFHLLSPATPACLLQATS